VGELQKTKKILQKRRRGLYNAVPMRKISGIFRGGYENYAYSILFPIYFTIKIYIFIYFALTVKDLLLELVNWQISPAF
jgi:hypothetical protein